MTDEKSQKRYNDIFNISKEILKINDTGKMIHTPVNDSDWYRAIDDVVSGTLRVKPFCNGASVEFYHYPQLDIDVYISMGKIKADGHIKDKPGKLDLLIRIMSNMLKMGLIPKPRVEELPLMSY
jgi:hypothetical protein